jgi:hypothetical protein
MNLSEIQQANLIDASKAGVGRIDGVVRKLKRECPNAFHTNKTLAFRVFYHKPLGETPHRGFVHESTEP